MAQIFKADLSEPVDMLKESVCVIGVFDGFHRGHQALVDAAIDDAKALNAKSVVITFDRDPDELFSHGNIRKLMSDDVRIQTLAESGVDDVVILEFTPSVAAMGSHDFMEKAFGATLPKVIHIGDDFRFGKAAEGDVRTLSAWGKARGVEVKSHPLLEIDGEPVKSTRIRKLLASGSVRMAAELLGRPYAIEGFVQRGRGEGDDMGFATANLSIPESQRVLADGVYGGHAIIDGRRYKAAISVGIPPTFEGEAKGNMEVHVLDYSGNLYGRKIEVEFIEYLRPMLRFDNVEDLIATVRKDISYVRNEML